MNLVYLNCCRLCASSTENSVPIFEEDGLSNFADKIKSYLHVEIINSNDTNDIPRMCNSCSEKIISWDQYAEQVQKVQELFTSLSTSDAEDQVELLKKLNRECLMMKGEEDRQNPKYVNSGDEIQCNLENHNRREKKKVKQKKGKKLKKAAVVKENSDGDFSEDDDLPLALQIDCSPQAVKSHLESHRTQENVQTVENGGSKSVHKIKLKIKDKTAQVINENEEDVIDEIDIGEKEAEYGFGDESNSSSKDDGKVRMPGLQSLFTWECLECQEPVKNWNALVKHCREAHKSNASVLCICGKQLQSRASIMKHRMKHTVGYGYKCDYENCNKTFHRQQLLDVHMLSHMPKELQPWMCCKCSRRFHTESLLKQHEKVHLPKEEKLIHPCEVCQKRFCSKSAVAAHIRSVHFGERPFVCDQCGHSFTSKGILHEHLTIHSDVYNFHCKDCNKSFKTKYRLKIHMDTHVETRYQCPVCTLTLNTRRTLRMHLLVHRDDKAFQCTTCGKAFKRSKDLKNHYNLHTGRRPYTCPFCLRTFANGSNCRSHKRRMHPEELKMYEAAIAAGQQPVIFRMEDEHSNERGNESHQPQHQQEQQSQQQQQQHHHHQQQQEQQPEFLEDSNESKSEGSESARKYSDEEEKPVSLMPDNDEKFAKAVDVVDSKSVFQGVEKYRFLNADTVPLNLQRNCIKKIKEEEEDDIVQTFAMNGDENIAANIAQIAFGNQSQTTHYPTHNLYTFQSSGIPAFPGNPFFRQ